MKSLPSSPLKGLSPNLAIDPTERKEIIVGILVAMFLAALDQTIVAPALPTIGSSLRNAEYLSWIVTAYLLTATAVMNGDERDRVFSSGIREERLKGSQFAALSGLLFFLQHEKSLRFRFSSSFRFAAFRLFDKLLQL